MFTTIMYGFINEVTRQPATAELPVAGDPHPGKARAAARRRIRHAAGPTRPLAGQYRVLADSFRVAAGFH